MKKYIKTICLMTVLALFGATALVRGQSARVTFTEFKFFSTKGEFNWDKVIYGDRFDGAALYELQVAIDFENPGSKPFNAEVKIYRDGKVIKTEAYKDLKDSGGFNSGVGGDAGTAGKVAPGLYKAEIWYGGKVVKTAEATVTDSSSSSSASASPSTSPGTGDVWHLIVESREDIGDTAAEFKAELKAAFEARGDTVVDSASKDSVDLYFYLGKDDADDDNDGKTDDKDVGDANTDGVVNEQDMAEVIDLDKEIPDVMDDFPDKDKKTGIYIYVETETGRAMVFVSDADSLKNETGASATSKFTDSAVFMNASFAARRDAFGGPAPAGPGVAGQIVNTIDVRVMKLYVGNLSYDTQEPDLRLAFESVGKVADVALVIDRNTGKPRGHAYVTMATPADAKRALGLDSTMLQGRPIKVNEAQERGGGGGGRSGSAGGVSRAGLR